MELRTSHRNFSNLESDQGTDQGSTIRQVRICPRFSKFCWSWTNQFWSVDPWYRLYSACEGFNLDQFWIFLNPALEYLSHKKFLVQRGETKTFLKTFGKFQFTSDLLPVIFLNKPKFHNWFKSFPKNYPTIWWK